MPPFSYLEAIDIHVANWSLELSPESHDEEIRGVQDEKVFYKNSEMEAVISEALRLRCHRIDLFFMIGLSQQTKASVLANIDYCEKLFQTSDTRLLVLSRRWGLSSIPAADALRSLSVTAKVCLPELLRSIGNFWFSLLGSIF